MRSLSQRSLLVVFALVSSALAFPSPAEAGQTLVVGKGAGEYHSIQAAVDDARAGDVVLLKPGRYFEAVTVGVSGITIRGEERHHTILDGRNTLGTGITVGADDVVVRTLTVMNYTAFGVQFSHVDGFQMTDISAFNNSEYGLYAIHSTRGDISYSYGEGHGDSAFYIGETAHCDCDVHHNEGARNMLGYSGTANSHLRIWANNFHDNRAGILMSVLPNEMGVDAETLEPYGTQVRTEIYDNWIHDNNNKNVPSTGIWETVHVPVGQGITIGGGWFNDVHHNRIENNALWGIGVFWLVTGPRGNFVHDNQIDGSRFGIWWDEWGEDHCFKDNAITNVKVVSDPAVLPSCPGLVGDLPCPSATNDWLACRASDARAPSLAKDAWLLRRALLDLDPDED